jgi:hypothetical protein
MVSQAYVDELFRKRHNERQKKSAKKRREKEKLNKVEKPKLTKEEKDLLTWARQEKKLIESGRHGKLLLDKVNKIIDKYGRRSFVVKRKS